MGTSEQLEGGLSGGAARLTASAGETPAGRLSGDTTELGIDIISVGRIRRTLARFGGRFVRRVLTPSEQRYVRDRAETLAGRWAAKEAVSKVLGLGVRGIGWRDIEIERLPTGQPAVRLRGRAAARAEQLGMARIAVSISHEADYAVAIAFGVRTAGGRYLFPPDIEDRLDERERRRPGHPRDPRIASALVRRQGPRGDHDGPARGRRGRSGARGGAGADPRPRPRRVGGGAGPSTGPRDTRADRRAACGPRGADTSSGGSRRGGSSVACVDRPLVGRHAPARGPDAACRRVRTPARRQRS